MKKFIKQLVVDYFPFLYFDLYLKFKSYLEHTEERRVMDGKNISSSSHQSIIFFGAHRSASTFIGGLLERLTSLWKMEHIDFDSFFTTYNLELQEKFEQDEFLDKAFFPQGYYYGPFRSFRDVPDLEQYRVLLLLRDPRDVLTSHFFSTRYSHGIHNRKILKKRRRAQERNLEEYVLEIAPKYIKIYTDYFENLIKRDLDNTLYTPYWQMVTDFEAWLSKVTNHLNLQHENVIEDIVEEVNFDVSEDKYEHKRQVTPGDYEQKLSGKTIDALNKEFRPLLTKMGFEV